MNKIHKIIRVGSLMLFFLVIFCMLDIYCERNFIKSAKQLVGKDEKGIMQHYKKQYYRTRNISTLMRRRWMALVWAMCGFEEGVAVYLKMNIDKVEEVLCCMWVPSMKYKE